MNDYSKFVPNVHFEQIPIRNLVSNQDYQRNLSQAHIARAAAHFDIFQINPVKVSRNQLCFQWSAHDRNCGACFWIT